MLRQGNVRIRATLDRLAHGGAAESLVEGARRASGNVGMAQGVSFIVPKAEGSVGQNVVSLGTGRDFMGENPIWSARQKKLLWLDILAPALRTFDPANGQSERIDLPEIVGGLTERQDGHLVLLGRHGIFDFDP